MNDTNLQQKPANELANAERHHARTFGTVAAVVIETEGDADLVEGDQAMVRDGNVAIFMLS